ncbi:MAG: outer membrane beta-barrel protein [Vicinamibacterales bacterium]
MTALTSTSILLALLVLPASAVSAQTIFVQGTVGVDIKRFSAETDKSAFDGTARAVVIGGGTELMRHLAVDAELSLSGESKTETTTDVVIFGQPRTIHNIYTSERRGLAVVAGYRTAAHHPVRLGIYGGVSFSIFRREIASDAASIVLNTAASASVFEERLTGPIVAFDATVRVSEHLGVISAVSVQGLKIGEELDGHSIQPSVGVRVSF